VRFKKTTEAGPFSYKADICEILRKPTRWLLLEGNGKGNQKEFISTGPPGVEARD